MLSLTLVRSSTETPALAAGYVLARRDDRVQLAAACSTQTLLRVKRILLTGMSGTGKSSIVRELAAHGFKAVDTDHGWSEPLPGGRQRWREDVIQALLATEDTSLLFVAGCEENQARFLSSSTKSSC